MFTFLTISYNQEKYIIEHLESIRYQIENYGYGRKFAYILADDGSEDGTVGLAQRWMKENDSLFCEVKILDSGKNRGIVTNYLRGINEVTTETYKCLAADDLYFKNNVIDLLNDSDIVLSPTLFFSDSREALRGKNMFYYGCAGKRGKALIKAVRNDLKYYCGIQAPGSFMKRDITQDRGLQKFLGNFKWIEDYPQWIYIFNQYQKSISVKLATDIYILYRADTGISTKNGQRNQLFLDEEQRIKKMTGNRREKYGKFLNVYRYLNFFKRKYIDYIKINTNSEAKEIRHNYEKARKEAEDYLCFLDKKASCFIKNM
ncbi:MAG: glycosyltransferase family 2 protein [Dorea sp.]|jgi:glycosyltransferase involved in cell wall biosynthesis|nr:glycosyltransferase family 2 protein [Dorea sp.]